MFSWDYIFPGREQGVYQLSAWKQTTPGIALIWFSKRRDRDSLFWDLTGSLWQIKAQTQWNYVTFKASFSDAENWNHFWTFARSELLPETHSEQVHEVNASSFKLPKCVRKQVCITFSALPQLQRRNSCYFVRPLFSSIQGTIHTKYLRLIPLK